MKIPQEEAARTFVTTTRVDLRHLAKIAAFLKTNGYEMQGDKSKSKLVSAAVQMIAEQLKHYEVESTAHAIMILQKLGYGDSMKEGRKDFKPIMRQMVKENLEHETKEQLNSHQTEQLQKVESYRKQLEPQKHVVSAEEQAMANLMLNPVEEPEPVPRERKLEKATKKKPTSIKEWTKEDEQADLRKQRDLFMGAPPLAAEEGIEDGEPSPKENVDKPNQNDQPESA